MTVEIRKEHNVIDERDAEIERLKTSIAELERRLEDVSMAYVETHKAAQALCSTIAAAAEGKR
jgi:DNA repair exonuclease SbcCD ATPase subunit